MFSSNQIFDVTCDFRDLARVIDFGVSLADDRECLTRRDGTVMPAFQITETGLYCFGRGTMKSIPPSQRYPCGHRGHDASEGWTDFPFKYDPEIIAKIVTQWVKEQPEPPHTMTDGSEEIGVRVMCKESVPDNGEIYMGIKNPFSTILVFQPYRQCYDK